MQKKKQDKMHQNKHQNKNKQHVPVLLERSPAVSGPEGRGIIPRPDGRLRRTRRGRYWNGLEASQRQQYWSTATKTRSGKLRKEFRQQAVSYAAAGFFDCQPGVARRKGGNSILFWQIWAYRHRTLTRANVALPLTATVRSICAWTSPQELTAETIVNTYSEAAGRPAEALRRRAESQADRRPDRAGKAALTHTDQLAAIAAKAWPGYSRVHPATRTFPGVAHRRQRRAGPAGAKLTAVV